MPACGEGTGLPGWWGEAGGLHLDFLEVGEPCHRPILGFVVEFASSDAGISSQIRL